jgi:hypothetical protein
MSIFLQNSYDFFGVPSRELEVSALLFVAMDSMKRIVRVNLYWRMRPEILPNGSGRTQVTSTIFSREDGDSDPHGLSPFWHRAHCNMAFGASTLNATVNRVFCRTHATKKPFKFSPKGFWKKSG